MKIYLKSILYNKFVLCTLTLPKQIDVKATKPQNKHGQERPRKCPIATHFHYVQCVWLVYDKYIYCIIGALKFLIGELSQMSYKDVISLSIIYIWLINDHWSPFT